MDVLMATENEFFCELTNDTGKNMQFANRILNHMENAAVPVKDWMTEDGWEEELFPGEHADEYIRDHMSLPDYNMDDITELGMGFCNIKLGYSYIHHLNDTIEIYTNVNHPGVYMFKNVYSRYSDSNKRQSRHKRTCIIDFNNDAPGIGPTNYGERLLYLQAGCKYYCSCKAGARTINPCAHITAILMYLHFITANCLDQFLAKHNAHYPAPMNCYRHKLWKTNHRINDNTFPDGIANEIRSVIDTKSDGDNTDHSFDRNHNRHAVQVQNSDDGEDWGSDADLSSNYDNGIDDNENDSAGNVIINDFDENTPLLFCHHTQHNIPDYNDNTMEMDVDSNHNRSSNTNNIPQNTSSHDNNTNNTSVIARNNRNILSYESYDQYLDSVRVPEKSTGYSDIDDPEEDSDDDMVMIGLPHSV